MTDKTAYNMLNTLCPMHIVFDKNGMITHAGPTALKVCQKGLIGQQFLDTFEIKRPRELLTLNDLYENAGRRLNLQFRHSATRQLKAVILEGPEQGCMTVNLSFGISVVDAVQEFNLTAADFAPTDLTVEMLYLVEAKSAAMEASRQLNERLQSARMEAEEQALTDTLTGLMNRRGMDKLLAQLVDGHESFAVMHIDLDFFKAVNDTYGHAAGDHVLQKAAEIMEKEVRKSDVVARVGGDEFVLLIREAADRSILAQIAERIIAKLKQPIQFDGNQCRISGSAGIVHAEDYEQKNADQMLGDADAALYAAKRDGRGRYAFFSHAMRDLAQHAEAQAQG